MATNDEIKAAENRGYDRGYRAGNLRKKKDMERERALREKQAFLDRAFMAALPSVILAQGWCKGANEIRDIPSRVGLAKDFALEALRKRPFAS